MNDTGSSVWLVMLPFAIFFIALGLGLFGHTPRTKPTTKFVRMVLVCALALAAFTSLMILERLRQ